MDILGLQSFGVYRLLDFGILDAWSLWTFGFFGSLVGSLGFMDFWGSDIRAQIKTFTTANPKCPNEDERK